MVLATVNAPSSPSPSDYTIRSLFATEEAGGPITNTNSNTTQSLLNTSLQSSIAADDYSDAILLLLETLGVRVKERIRLPFTVYGRDFTEMGHRHVFFLMSNPWGEGASECWITSLLDHGRRDLDSVLLYAQ
ncbi:hypothetical protein PM082_010975 [Marasmius tenuissimus]|nr:hypothetical protein PM082_010975 [Marasmius tenuissimus]